MVFRKWKECQRKRVQIAQLINGWMRSRGIRWIKCWRQLVWRICNQQKRSDGVHATNINIKAEPRKKGYRCTPHIIHKDRLYQIPTIQNIENWSTKNWHPPQPNFNSTRRIFLTHIWIKKSALHIVSYWRERVRLYIHFYASYHASQPAITKKLSIHAQCHSWPTHTRTLATRNILIYRASITYHSCRQWNTHAHGLWFVCHPSKGIRLKPMNNEIINIFILHRSGWYK